MLYVATNSQSAYACKQGGELEEDNEEGLRVAEEDEEGSIELEGNKEGWIHYTLERRSSVQMYRWVTGCCCWKLLFPFINASSASFPIVSASPYATK